MGFFGRGNGSTPQQINSGGTGGVTGVMQGNQSGIGKAFANDPVNNFLFGTKPRYVMPTAGPWAGQAPSLAAANSGYGVNSTGNPQLNGGGVSPQIQATFASKPASFMPTPGSAPTNNASGYLNASRGVM